MALWRPRPTIPAGPGGRLRRILAAVLGCWQLKLLPYAGWLAAVPLAVWAARLPGTATLSAPLLRVAAIVLLSQASLEAGFAALSPRRRPLGRAGRDGAAVGRPAPALLPIGQRPPPGRAAAGARRRRHRSWPLHRRAVAAPRRGGPLPSARQGHPRQPRHPAGDARGGLAAARRARRQLPGAVRRPPGPRADGGTLRVQLLAGRRIDASRAGPAAGTPIRVWQIVSAR